jgi:hypothetical protein
MLELGRDGVLHPGSDLVRLVAHREVVEGTQRA